MSATSFACCADSNAARRSGHERDAGLLHLLAGAGLRSHHFHRSRRRSDELDAGAGTGLGELRILRKESVAGMNCVRATAFRDVKNFCDVEVRLRRSCSANRIGLICHQNVQRGAIHIRKDGNRGNPQLAAGTNHPHRDLSPISDKNLLEHELCGRERPARAAAAPTRFL